MKSSDAAIIRDGLKEYTRKKKKVKFECESNSAGAEINKILYDNTYTLSNGGEWKNCNVGFGYKDFTVKYDSEESAQAVVDNIKKIMDNTSDAPGAYEHDPDVPVEDVKESKSTLLIVAGVVLLAAIVLFVWKKNK